MRYQHVDVQNDCSVLYHDLLTGVIRHFDTVFRDEFVNSTRESIACGLW